MLLSDIIPTIDYCSFLFIRTFRTEIEEIEGKIVHKGNQIPVIYQDAFDKFKIESVINALEDPLMGGTPITAAINAAVIDLEKYSDNDRKIILLTDGEENGEGDYIDAAKKASSLKGIPCKIFIVGVAQDIQNLMKEHQSSDRLFAGSVINLPSMTNEELTLIIRNAEQSIEKLIVFEDTATEKILALSKGHPYIVHLLGKQTYRTAFLEPRYSIDDVYIEEILKGIAEKEADPILEGRYKKAVASSKQREIVLKAFASSAKGDGEILTSDAYRISEEKGVENASQYVGQLVIEDYGAELIKVRERYYRFKDSLFQTYALARPQIF